MKLNLSTNLRRLRTANGMTQEDLADILGVTHKAISRWETGTAYPDIEMLPSLAEYFGVSLEELLGTTPSERDRASKEYYDRWHNIHNIDAEIDLLREMHREFPRDIDVLANLHIKLGQEIVKNGKIENLGELRRYTDEMIALEGLDKDYSPAYACIAGLIEAEEEEKLQPLLEKYTMPLFMSRGLMLERRYGSRGENDKHEFEHQQNFMIAVAMMYERFISSNLCKANVNECMWGVKKRLALLELLTDNSDSSIPDAWFDFRFDAMVRLACYLAMTDEQKAALDTLESAIDLYEMLWRLPEGAPLPFHCSALSAATGTVEYDTSTHFDPEQNTNVEYDTRWIIRNMYGNALINPVIDIRPLTAKHGWEGFDSIREDERYKNCVKRMKLLIKTHPANGK